jgi:tRNA pseudouridine55 synthase
VDTAPWQHITDVQLAAAAARFVGEVRQVPCLWSSSKYRNKPLRWYAERGEAVALQPKAVQFSSVELWREPRAAAGSSSSAAAEDGGDQAQQQQQGLSDVVHFRVIGSKGASVRVLAHDLGRALGCGAHVSALRRCAIGGFSVDTAWSLEVLLPLARKYAKGVKGRS